MPKCLVFKTIFPGEMLKKEWIKERMMELFLFFVFALCAMAVLLLLLLEAMQHRDILMVIIQVS